MSAPVLSRPFIVAGRASSPTRPAFVVQSTTRNGMLRTSWLSELAPITRSSEPFLFPKLRNYFADFPYLHYSSWPEAANLGDLMRLWVRPGVKLSHPGFHGPSRAHLIPRKARYSSRFAALARDNPISGPLICKKEKITLPEARAGVPRLTYVAIQHPHPA